MASPGRSQWRRAGAGGTTIVVTTAEKTGSRPSARPGARSPSRMRRSALASGAQSLSLPSSVSVSVTWRAASWSPYAASTTLPISGVSGSACQSWPGIWMSPLQGGEGAAGDRGVDVVQVLGQAGAVFAVQEGAQHRGQLPPVGRVLAFGEVLFHGGAGLVIAAAGGGDAGDHRVPRRQLPGEAGVRVGLRAGLGEQRVERVLYRRGISELG